MFQGEQGGLWYCDAYGSRTEQQLVWFQIPHESAELCGRQGFALRGHRDDFKTYAPFVNCGNLRALVNFRIDSGDTALKHMETYARNASYISKSAQNELLECMKWVSSFLTAHQHIKAIQCLKRFE